MDEAKAKHYEVVDLDGDKANRERFMGTLEKTSPRFVFLNGHGNEKVVAGQNNEVLLKESDTAIKDKIIYARACKSAQTLGPQTIENGATAYIGYVEDFIFVSEESKEARPTEDKVAALFLEPSNQVALSLLKGHSAEEADRRAKEKFRENIEAVMLKGPRGLPGYYAILFNLAWDLRNQVCLGDKNATL
jgi:hypothetical protein